MPSELSPTARALRTMELLMQQPGATAGDLAARLGVTERAARRYIGILREAGIPVESVRGPYGGYRLGRGTRLPPVVFTEPEALGLVMAVLNDMPATAGDADDLLGSALGKVIRALPESVGRQAAAMRDLAAATPDRYPSRPDPALTSALVAAIGERRRVRVAYRSEAGNEWAAEVDPWAVVVRHSRWYLLCHSHRADAIRTYRIDRIHGVEPTGHGFQPPAGLDPVMAVEENLGAGWEYPTRVVFDRPAAEVSRWVRPAMGRLEPAGDGCALVGSTSNPRMYAEEWLSTIPLPFRVAGGPELRAAVRAVAERFAAAVGEAAAVAEAAAVDEQRTAPATERPSTRERENSPSESKIAQSTNLSGMASFNDTVIENFRAHDGVLGGHWEGKTTLLLHTPGRKSGKVTINPLVAAPDGDSYIVCGSAGGTPAEPQWVANLEALDGPVDIELGADEFKADFRVVRPGDADWDRLYGLWRAYWPDAADYETKTDRKFPVAVITPRS